MLIVWKTLRTTGVFCSICLGGAAMNGATQNCSSASRTEKKAVPEQSGFYCNIKALDANERIRHKKLTEKLIASRTETVETNNGYEFQYRQEVSLAEVAEWVAMESKCCPFFDFHIDLENEGRLVCLRLTGREGIKAFIRLEFGL